jgi:hypothetical protein
MNRGPTYERMDDRNLNEGMYGADADNPGGMDRPKYGTHARRWTAAAVTSLDDRAVKPDDGLH